MGKTIKDQKKNKPIRRDLCTSIALQGIKTRNLSVHVRKHDLYDGELGKPVHLSELLVS